MPLRHRGSPLSSRSTVRSVSPAPNPSPAPVRRCAPSSTSRFRSGTPDRRPKRRIDHRNSFNELERLEGKILKPPLSVSKERPSQATGLRARCHAHLPCLPTHTPRCRVLLIPRRPAHPRPQPSGVPPRGWNRLLGSSASAPDQAPHPPRVLTRAPAPRLGADFQRR